MIPLNFNDQGLIPVIVQQYDTKEVLMLAYMNREAFEKTMNEKVAYYYSRKRKSLWKKGETSGHYQYVKQITLDCDQDTLLLLVDQEGVACHTNRMSCFFDALLNEDEKLKPNFKIEELYAKIKDRKINPVKDSYTNYLFDKGLDKILKKVGEETAEVIIASKNQSKDELTLEISDLVYHTMVLMVNQGITIDMIREELKKRSLQ